MIDQLKKEIEEFRIKGHEFLDKKLTVAEFKGISGGMGVYAQRGGEKFMVRLRIHSGVLYLNTFKMIYNFALRYGLKQIHFTTRQTIQLHDLTIDEVCDIMQEALENGVHTRGGGGNFPRNVSLSPLSGVDINEPFDPTPFALLVNKHFMGKITSYHLPRKFKVAFSNNDNDTANATVNDLGFIATLKDDEPYFKVFIGGGLGNNPIKAIEYPELSTPEDILYHVEAMTNLFIDNGNYENKAKARIRYIINSMGEENFINCYTRYLSHAQGTMKLKELHPKDINQHYKPNINDECFGKINQKQENLVAIELKPAKGQLSLDNVKKLIDFFDTCSDKLELRLSMKESLYVRNLTQEKANELLELIKPFNCNCDIEKSIVCIGVPTCQVGIANTQQLYDDIINYLTEQDVDYRNLPLLQISGCNNSCARHQMSQIGLSGRKKNVNGVTKEVFELYIDGDLGYKKTRLGKSCGTVLSENIPYLIGDICKSLEKKKSDFNSFLKTNDNIYEVVNKYVI